jgi:hypothetical protein
MFMNAKGNWWQAITLGAILGATSTLMVAIQAHADDCTSPLDTKQWHLQCGNDKFALFCDKKGEEKKCACVRGGKYLYTYGVHCSDLPCFHKKCP